jgi:asparagine synthase (glutamine-hydrolysing)
MCGITGVVSNQNLNQKDLKFLNYNIKNLKHRGPDEFGKYIEKKIILGHTRLSIIDPDKGQQPMKNKDLVLIANAEIYNYIEIKKKLKNEYKFFNNSDCEVILALYKKYSLNFVNYLEGMFAFALWDKKKKYFNFSKRSLGRKTSLLL